MTTVAAELVTLKQVDSNDCGLNGGVIRRCVRWSLITAATPPWLVADAFLVGRGSSTILKPGGAQRVKATSVPAVCQVSVSRNTSYSPALIASEIAVCLLPTD